MQNYGIYLAKIMDYLQKLWDIFVKTKDILGQKYGIYWVKTICYIMGYI